MIGMKKGDLFVEVVPESLVGTGNLIQIKSTSRPGVTYSVNIEDGTCSCPAWIYQRGGSRKPCKHLRAAGFTETLASTRGIKHRPS